jgi:mannose-6-phosphate isomerase-like protein (cupin superfamily)
MATAHEHHHHHHGDAKGAEGRAPTVTPFGAPTPISHGQSSNVDVAGHKVHKMIMEPGWRWSNDIKPMAKTDSCQRVHILLAISGRMAIKMDNGEEHEIGPNNLCVIPQGHDAWVVGSEPFVAVEFEPEHGHDASSHKTFVLGAFDKPDNVMEAPLSRVDTVNAGGITASRVTTQPGWKWSTALKPIVKTDACIHSHFFYNVSGTVRFSWADGRELETKPDAMVYAPADHDAWVVGDQPFVALELGARTLHDAFAPAKQ